MLTAICWSGRRPGLYSPWALLVVLLPAILILVLVVVLVGASAIVFFRAA